MDIIKKLFAGDKLSTYEKEQKRRYKQYVKLGATSTIVMSKTESEIYQDYLVRRSLRRSKRKAAATKEHMQEDFFKDTESNPGLSAAPAVLDAINRNISVANVPNEYLYDLKQMETVTVETRVSNTSNKEGRRHSSVSIEVEVQNYTKLHPKRNTQPLDQKFAYGNQDMFLDQLDDVIRKRNRGHSLENISHASQIPIYENINNVEEHSPTILAVKPRKKVPQIHVEAKRTSENIDQYTPKEQAQRNEIATVSHSIHPNSQYDSSIDYYQSETEEIVWGTPPSNMLLPISRSSSCITTQSEDSFFDCISEDDDIYDDEEKIVMKQISPPFIKHPPYHHEPETDFRSLGSEDDLDERDFLPPLYENIVKKVQPTEHQNQNDVLIDIKSTNDKQDNWNLLDDSIEPDSLELAITNGNIAESVNPTNPINSESPELRVQEAEGKDDIPHITSWAEKVRIKEHDFASDEKSKEEVHQKEEVLIHDEALLLDDGFNDPKLLKPPRVKPTKRNELIKLENNNDYSDSDTDNYRTDSKKVTFDFAKSYCQTYEVEQSTEEEEYEDSPIHSPMRRDEDKLFEHDEFFANALSRLKKHNLENTVPTDDRSKVFFSYGVQPTSNQKDDAINRSFETSVNMDLAFLNCMDGFNSQLVQPKSRNISIIELDEQSNEQNQDSDSKQNIDAPNLPPDEILESVQNQKELLLIDKEDTDNNLKKSDFDNEVLEHSLLNSSVPNSSLTEVDIVLPNKIYPDSTHDLTSNIPQNILEEFYTPPTEVNTEDIVRKNSFSNDTQLEIKESEGMLLTKTSENTHLPFSDVIANRNSANILDDSISTIDESGEILKPSQVYGEAHQHNLSDEFGYINDIDLLVLEQGDANYFEAINLVLKEDHISNKGYCEEIESPVGPTQPLSLESFTNVKTSETTKDSLTQELQLSPRLDVKAPSDYKTHGSFSPNTTSPKLVRWESDSYIPQYKPVFEIKQEVNITNEQKSKYANTTNINDKNSDIASTSNSPISTSYTTLNRSTSAPHDDKYKTKRAMIYSNRNIFTTNARKPIQRSVSQSFGFAFVSPAVNNRHSADYSESHRITGGKISEESDSLTDIQRRLSAVRHIESPEKQLTTIQELLIELKEKANMLESKTDDEYVRLLQTLFKCIRIVSGLQCNFDQDLLVSQQNTLKEIKDCISDLNTI